MLFLMVSSLGFQLIVGVFIGVLRALGVNTGSLWVFIAIFVASFLLPLFLWLKITGESFRKSMPNQPLGLVNILLIIALSLLIQPLMMLVSGFSSLFFPNTAAELLSTVSAQPWWLMMLALAVAPGVIEELVFRGYLQSAQMRGFRSGQSFAKIALMNGLLFAIMHLNPHQFLYTFFLGIFFAYVVHYTKSIWAGIISHFTLNGSQVTLANWATQAVAYQDVPDITFAQSMYNAFAETNPALAQSLYDFFSNISPEVVAIIGASILSAITAPIAIAIFITFKNYNKARNLKTPTQTEPTPEIILDPDAPPQQWRQRIDWYLLGVILLFIAIIAIT